MDIISIAVGATGVGFAYFLYLAGTKGLPAAWAWVKAKWTAGKAEAAALAADVDSAHARIDALESAVKNAVAEIAQLKAATPVAAQPVAAPAPQA